LRKVIDVSAFQKDIDYEAVVASGVTGVIIKISEGCEYEDTFLSHLSRAQAVGLDIGVYCYSHATTADRAIEEANEVIYLLNKSGALCSLGIWFDMEDKKVLNSNDPTGVATSFISHCNDSGLWAGIYASLSTFTDILDLHQIADYVPYWCAQYDSRCNFADYFPTKTLAGWQYSDSQYIGDTNVDLNEWYD